MCAHPPRQIQLLTSVRKAGNSSSGPSLSASEQGLRGPKPLSGSSNCASTGRGSCDTETVLWSSKQRSPAARSQAYRGIAARHVHTVRKQVGYELLRATGVARA